MAFVSVSGFAKTKSPKDVLRMVPSRSSSCGSLGIALRTNTLTHWICLTAHAMPTKKPNYFCAIWKRKYIVTIPHVEIRVGRYTYIDHIHLCVWLTPWASPGWLYRLAVPSAQIYQYLAKESFGPCHLPKRLDVAHRQNCCLGNSSNVAPSGFGKCPILGILKMIPPTISNPIRYTRYLQNPQ